MSVRSEIVSFLHQRKRACQSGYLFDASLHLAQIGALLRSFDLIKNMNDWRHLREIYLQQTVLIDLLPSENGKHAKIRARLLELIARANEEASKPRLNHIPDNYVYQFGDSR